MKKLYVIPVVLCLLFSYLTYPIHPRAESAITSLQNRLQQLQVRYNPSLAQNIQSTINLLNVYEPDMARKFQAELNELNKQRPQELLSRPTRDPQPEPLPEVRPQPSKPPTDVPPAPPVTKPATPPAPNDLPPALPVPKPIIRPAPTDLPPAPPAPSDAPPALPATTSGRPLPVPSAEKALKNKLTGMQLRALAQLKYYVPTIEGLSVEDAEPIIKNSLKQLILDVSRQNSNIKSYTENFASQRTQGLYGIQLPNVDVRIPALASLKTASKLYAVLYGTKVSTPLVNYLAEMEADFVTVLFGNARARINQINQIMDEVAEFPTALNDTNINDTFRSLLTVNRMVTELQTLKLTYITTFIEPSPQASAELASEMRLLFDRFKTILISVKGTFDLYLDDPGQKISLPLTIAQRNCYELLALIIQIYAHSLPIPLTQKEQSELTNLIQSNLSQMTTTILKLKLHLGTK